MANVASSWVTDALEGVKVEARIFEPIYLNLEEQGDKPTNNDPQKRPIVGLLSGVDENCQRPLEDCITFCERMMKKIKSPQLAF